MKQILRIIIMVLSLVGSGKALAQVAGFTMSSSSGCAPQVIYFTNTSTGSITSYSWNFGNGASSVLKDPSTTYTSPGTYTVTLTVTFSGGGTATSSSSLIIYPKPVVSFNVGSAMGCKPHTAAFSSTITANAPGPVTYFWNFGDGSTDTVANPTHIYTTTGTYGVSLTVTSGAGCATTFTMPAFVRVLGNSSFTASPLSSCGAPANVSFNTAALTGVTTGWTFGDGGTGSGNSVFHTYLASGSYTVRMMQYFASASCTDTVTRPAYIQVRGRTSSFSSPSAICVNGVATFTNMSSTNGTAWNFGDGKTGYGLSIQHTYTTAGTFTVRMITMIGGCPDTAFNNITVHPRPSPVINMSPALPCPAPVTLSFTASGVPAGSSYSWSWASGGSATGVTATKTYNTGYTRDSVMLLVTTPAGCVGFARKDSVEINDMVVKKVIHPLEGCIPLVVYCDSAWLETSYPDSNIYPAAITSYRWNFGDGSAASYASSVAHTYNSYGTYIDSITLTTANGCTITDTVRIHAGTKIPPSYTVLADSICINPGQLIQNTTLPPAPWYNWDVLPFGGPPWTPHYVYQRLKIYALGTNRVYLTSYNNGCRDTTSRLVRTIGTGALFMSAIQCPPSRDVVFTNLSVGVTSLLWDFGDGTTSTSMATVITHTYPSFNTYTCRLYTYDATTGCADTVGESLTLRRPSSSLYVSDTTVCVGQKVLLIGSFNGTAIGYSWAVDNVNLRRRDTVRHLWLSLSPGYHTITFRDTFQTYGSDTLTCVDSIRRVNHIFVSNPVASFSVTPLIGCVPLPVTFTSNSTFTPGAPPAKLKWDYGDGGIDSGLTNSYNHTYSTAGLYNVLLTVTDSNGCSSASMQPGLIDARRIMAMFSANKTTACVGDVIQFAGNMSSGAYPLTYLWSFGDGTTSTQDNPSHAYAATGNYTVQLIATDAVTGCADTLTRLAFVAITKPHASFTLSDTFAICAPLIDTFTSTSTGAVSYAWSFGDGNSSPLANPINTYAVPGIFSVRLIVTDAAGCIDTSSATTVQILGYAGALTYRPLIGCEPLTVNFRALVTNAPSLTWDFSDGVTKIASGDTISHTYLTRGAYVPKLIFSNNAGCTSSSVGLDTIKVDGVIAGFKTSPPCENTIITFFDTSSGAFLNPILSMWTFDSGQVKIGNPTTWAYPATGVYVVKLKSKNWNNCEDSITKLITVLPRPTVKASNDTAVCVPDAVPLSASGALTYTWTPGASLSCINCPNPMAAPTKATAYIVAGTDSNGCVNRDTVVVGIQRHTTFSTLDSGQICAGQSFQLHASGATLYLWSPDSSLDHPDIPDPIATPTKSTTYFVVAQEGSCIADTQKVRLTVNALPLVDAGSDERIVAGGSVTLQASGTNINHLVWSPDSLLSCSTCYSPIAKPAMTTTYYLTAYSAKGCIATDSVTVHVLCDGSQLFIPNTFTPNGDGLNDYFYPRSEGISSIASFSIYNRWGELLFNREAMAVNDEQAGWDGTAKGQKLAPDVYVYVIIASCRSGEQISLKGDVTIMR